MNQAVKAILLGMSLVGMACRGDARQQDTAPAQDQQENQADATSKGIKPHASAERYASHGEANGVAVGATVLTPDEVRQIFTTDLNNCCVVVEVGLFPETGKSLEVGRENFSLRATGTNAAVKPSSPNILATGSRLSPRGGSMTPHGSVGVTVGSGGGYYPGLGQTQPGPPPPGQPMPGSGVDTSADVTIGANRPESQPTDSTAN